MEEYWSAEGPLCTYRNGDNDNDDSVTIMTGGEVVQTREGLEQGEREGGRRRMKGGEKNISKEYHGSFLPPREAPAGR